MEQIDQKITTIINHFNLNNYAFSKRIGVTGTTIDSIVNGRPQPDGSRKKTKPGYDVLSAIIDEFDINPDYLFGKSAVLLKSKASKTPTYSGMPKVVSTTPDGKENVVYVASKARAGYLDGYGDAEFIESLPVFKMPQLTNGTFRCFEVQGNSMLKTFYDGDMVFGKFVESFNDIKDGRVYVIVSKNDGIVLKRVYNLTKDQGFLNLKSDNTDGNYPNFNIKSEDVVEIWYVTMYASKQMPEPLDVNDKLNDLEVKIKSLEQLVSNK
ncbi:MAG: LexA family transcriptional regulator [Psychroserpens sp.]|uniref:LexA family transcriptional regulator n=1 Tax=Psychroserpens sp. TaxID=2020870 RepID=UPI00300259FD